METQSMNNLAEFITNQKMVCQTELVDELLKNDYQLTFYNHVYNLEDFTVELSEGKFTGNLNQLIERSHETGRKIDTLTEQLNALKKKMDTGDLDLEILNNVVNSLRQCEKDIKALGNPVERKKHILEWWLVPYWISELLIEKGEVVFRHYGCNWWGRCSVRPILNDKMLQSIAEEFY